MKKKTLLQTVFALVLVGLCVASAGCISKGTTSSGDSTDDGGSTTSAATIEHEYLVIPGASFIAGKPPSTPATSGSQPTATIKSGSPTIMPGATTIWTVDFEMITEFEITEIIIWTEELDGYFEYELSAEEIAQGWVEIETSVQDTPPSTSSCVRDYRGNGTCYGPADTGLTNMDFAASNGVPDGVADTAIVDFSLYFELEVTVYTVEEYNTIVEDGSGGTDGDGGSDGGSYSDGDCYTVTGACGSCDIQSCCNADNQCWYNINGSIYNCSGDDCSSAANAAAQRCVCICGWC